MSRFSSTALAALAAAALSITFFVSTTGTAQAAPKAACSTKAYSYAGLFAQSTAGGIRATITATRQTTVASGHVAGWIGVGGTDAGPNGEPEWLQIGLNATDDGKTELYGELWKPGIGHVYQSLGPVETGKAYRLAVVEVAPSTWQAYLNGKPVSKRHLLPGSHGSFAPMAMTESWNGGQVSCNSFTYRFEQVQLRQGGWSAMTSSNRVVDAGYRLNNLAGGFLAGSTI